MTHLANGNTALSISLTAIGTALTVIATPFNLSFWGGLYPPTASILQEVSLNPIELIKTNVLLAIIPLIAGMFVNAKWPTAAEKISRFVKPISILLFIGFVIVAFTNNFEIFIEFISTVFFIVLIHNAIALAGGYWFANLCKLSVADQRTIAIETGIQNSGLGLLLIFTFFSGLGGMAIVAAWWGIWHIISGLSVSYYLSANTATQPA
jgi:BASS family bile acid:Na+ symporter